MREKDIFFDYIHKGLNLEVGFYRYDYLDYLDKLDGENIIKVITGIRRVGKSYILKQFIEKILKRKDLSIENIFYLHLEDDRLLDDFSVDDLRDIFDYYLENYYKGGVFYVFLDEIQNITNWQNFLRTINEKYGEKCQIFITGSNSNLLSGELSTLLTGRYIQLNVYPFSFSEYLKINNLEISSINPKKYEYFENYLSYGALPEVIKIKDEETKVNYIKTLVDSILYKDIVQRYSIRKTKFLYNLNKYIYNTITSNLSINSILKYLKQNIKTLDYETIDNYIGYLENSFLINSISSINPKTKELLKGNMKYYAYDTGIRRIVSGNNDVEKDLENYVYLELKRRGYYVNVIHNPEYEIDFFAQKDNKKIYFQVSYTFKNDETYEREIKPLLLQKDNYDKYILTLDDVNNEDRGVLIKNVIDFSLDL